MGLKIRLKSQAEPWCNVRKRFGQGKRELKGQIGKRRKKEEERRRRKEGIRTRQGFGELMVRVTGDQTFVLAFFAYSTMESLFHHKKFWCVDINGQVEPFFIP